MITEAFSGFAATVEAKNPKDRMEWVSCLPCGLVGAEVGVAQGMFSNHILDTAKPKIHYMVDLWSPVYEPYPDKYSGMLCQYRSIRRALLRTRDHILAGVARPIVGDSHFADRFFEKESLDYVYIDASHTEENCLLDLQKWGSKVKSGGVISGHDISITKIGYEDYGVDKAVERYINSILLPSTDLHIIREEWSSFWFIKP